MPAGRPPKSKHERELIGGGGHRPLPEGAPEYAVGTPEMPKGLTRKAARRAWEHWTKLLLESGVLTVADGPALAMACDAFADWEEAERDCRKNGLLIDTPMLDKMQQPIFHNGKMLVMHKANPAFAIKTSAMKTMKTFLDAFGLTPASRPRIKGEPKKPEDALTSALDWMPDTDSNMQRPSLADN